MKAAISAGLLFVAACASASSDPQSTGTSTAQPSATTNPAEEAMANECATLIGSINAGVAHVTQMESAAASSGQDELNATASALESVARAIEERTFQTADLQRLGGFYVGVAKAQAQALRDMAGAFAKGDASAMGGALTRFEELGKQEDIVVEELNQKCARFSAPPTQ